MEQPSVREASERIEVLLDELGQSAPPAVMGRVEELLQCVMGLYGAGLERVLETVGPPLVRRLADDELVGNLLVLNDLHPDDVDTRVQRALDQVRPYLGSHAGGVSLSNVDADGVVHLQLEGSCDGCPSSAMTVKSAIEDAILAAAPDVVAVEAEGMVETAPSLLQIGRFEPHETQDGWVHLDLDVPPGTMSHVHAGDPGDTEVLVANLSGTLVAYVDHCPACLLAPSKGSLDGVVLTCSCGTSYDVRLAGRAFADGGAPLAPLPLLPEGGAWKVAVPAGATS
ncbi:MAG: NifU family protein [Nocardioides sp.]